MPRLLAAIHARIDGAALGCTADGAPTGWRCNAAAGAAPVGL